jgi:ATP-dependent DNA ligase
MTSSKRDFSDFTKFPGKIVDIDGAKKYIFGPIEYKDTTDRARIWTTYIQLLTNGNIQNLTQDDLIGTKKYKTDTIARLWTETGLKEGKIMKSKPTIISEGKNIGKSNETNVFTQALILGRSKYLKQLQAAGGILTAPKNGVPATLKRYFPQAAHKIDESPRDPKKGIIWPAAVQRKLDGGRAVAYWDTTADTATLYSRKLHDLSGNKHILADLTALYRADISFDIKDMKDNIETINIKDIYIDGEIYKHGLSLQRISGIMKREEGSKTTARELKQQTEQIKLEFHIFDIFVPAHKHLTLEQRLAMLDIIFKTASVLKLQYLVKVETIIAASPNDESTLYSKFLEEGYEGTMIKNLAAPYEIGLTKEKRTYHVRKHKPRYSDEYEVVGFTQGEQGKDKGAILWILQTKGKKDKILFNATPTKMTYQERYDLWTQLSNNPAIFESDWKGKMMTTEYDDLSESGVPLRAKALNIRVLD